MIDEELIRELAIKESDLRQSLSCMDMMNTAGMSWDELSKMRADYAVMRAKLIEAQAHLEDAIHGRIAKMKKEE